VPPQSSNLNAAAAGVTTLPTIAVEVSGKKRGRLLESASKGRRMASARACQHQNRPQLDLLRAGETGPRLEPRIRGGSDVKYQSTNDITSNPSGAGGRTGGRSAPVDGQLKPVCPWALVVDPQQPQPKHTDSSSPSTTESITTRGDHRPPRQPSHLRLRRVDTPSALRGLVPPNRRGSPANHP
jgi:hypothetical protein